MRLLVHLCNQRLLNYHMEYLWPMSEKAKKLIPTNKVVFKEQNVEDYGWPVNRKYLLKQTNKSKQESVSRS